jgi:DNA-binding response OmpR family regulator
LRDLRPLEQPPLLIVTSRLADDALWSEALNLGAHDVLAQPFDRHQVERVFASARRRFEFRPELARGGARMANVA